MIHVIGLNRFGKENSVRTFLRRKTMIASEPDRAFRVPTWKRGNRRTTLSPYIPVMCKASLHMRFNRQAALLLIIGAAAEAETGSRILTRIDCLSTDACQRVGPAAFPSMVQSASISSYVYQVPYPQSPQSFSGIQKIVKIFQVQHLTCLLFREQRYRLVASG